jgi:hypothetical protein
VPSVTRSSAAVGTSEINPSRMARAPVRPLTDPADLRRRPDQLLGPRPAGGVVIPQRSRDVVGVGDGGGENDGVLQGGFSPYRVVSWDAR